MSGRHKLISNKHFEKLTNMRYHSQIKKQYRKKWPNGHAIEKYLKEQHFDTSTHSSYLTDKVYGPSITLDLKTKTADAQIQSQEK